MYRWDDKPDLNTKVQKSKSIDIRMDKDKKIYFKKDSFSIDTFADDFVSMSVNFDKETEVYIHADEALAYKYVMYLLKCVKSAGFEKVSLITL